MNALQLGGQKISSYFKESYAEMKHIVWPNRRQIISHTLLVILFSVLIAFILGSLDLIFAWGLEKLIINK